VVAQACGEGEESTKFKSQSASFFRALQPQKWDELAYPYGRRGLRRGLSSRFNKMWSDGWHIKMPKSSV